MSARYPADLAKHVARRISFPPLAVLVELFEVMYFASLKSEEAESISCRVAFVKREDPDPEPPGRKVKDRWQCFALKNDLPFTVRTLVKISKAVDPWTSTLAVDTDSGGQLRIWGLIDQSVHYNTFVMKETDSGAEMPGIFQAAIQGVGDIGAYRRYVFLGALRQDTLVTKQQRVLQNGPIRNKLIPSIEKFQRTVAEGVGRSQYLVRDHWDQSLEWEWISALCRILIGIRRYGHGGAVLISDGHDALKPKYSLDYPRLAESLLHAGILAVQKTSFSDVIHEEYLEHDDLNDLPIDIYLDECVTGNELEETQDEITGCIRFISSLSRVDGLIWLKHDLSLQGFGVEITSKKEPKMVFRAEDSAGLNTTKIDMNHFGTRHRSMIRHCAADQGSVGFVVSQDGDVRAISSVDEKVILWEEIRLLSLHNAKTTKAKKKRKKRQC
jgi:hypothetical protein